MRPWEKAAWISGSVIIVAAVTRQSYFAVGLALAIGMNVWRELRSRFAR